jgi:hypothetical protein
MISSLFSFKYFVIMHVDAHGNKFSWDDPKVQLKFRLYQGRALWFHRVRSTAHRRPVKAMITE